MTQVFLVNASTSPWTVPADFSIGSIVDTTGLGTYGNGISFGGATSTQLLAQTFTPTTSGPLSSVDIHLRVPFGATSDQARLQLYSGDLTGGTLGSLLATATDQTVTSVGSFATSTFPFPSPATVTANTIYTLVLSRTGTLADTPLYWADSTATDVYSGGNVYLSADSVNFSVFDTTLWLKISVGSHTVELLSSSGTGAAGTSGASGNGGGGGGGGAYHKLIYSAGTITPGSTTIPFWVSTAGFAATPPGLGSGCSWEANSGGAPGNLSNCYSNRGGGLPTGVTGGGVSSTLDTTGTPAITYSTSLSFAGGVGGSSGKNLGGGGGGAAAGPLNSGGAGRTPTTTAGGGGGGADNGATGDSAGQTGGTGSSGAGGGASSAGTGNSGGGGSNAGRNTTGGAGGNVGNTGGQEFDSTHGTGGGGGGSGADATNETSTNTGGAGGLYGGGGGGCGYARGTGTFVVGVGQAGLIVITYVPFVSSFVYFDDQADFQPYRQLPRRRQAFDARTYMVDAIFVPPTPPPAWQFNAQEVQPPKPKPERRAAGTMHGDDGNEQIQLRWTDLGWPVQPPQPPHPKPERFASHVGGDSGNEAPFVYWKNAGYEAIWHQPNHPRPERAAALLPAGIAPEAKYNFFYPHGWLIQPHQPQHPRPERFAAIAPKEDGTEAIFNFFTPFTEVQSVQPPGIISRSNVRFAGLARGDDGTEAELVVTATFTFSPDQSQDPLRSRPTRWAGSMDSSRDIDGGLVQFFTYGFSAQEIQPPHIRFGRWAATIDMGRIDVPFNPAFPTGFEVQSWQPPHIRRERAMGAYDASFDVDASYANFFPHGWEIQPPPPPHPRPERWGAMAPLSNIDSVYAPFIPWEWNPASVQPPHPRPERSGAIAPIATIEVTYAQFFPLGFEVAPVQPAHPRPERFAGLITGIFPEAVFTPLVATPAFWEMAVPLLWHPRPEKAGAILRGHDGNDNFLPWFNAGWEIQAFQPPHPHPELRAGGIMRGPDGIDYILLGWVNDGWEIMPVQPPHPWTSRKMAAIIKQWDHAEGSGIIPPPSIQFVFRPLMGVGI